LTSFFHDKALYGVRHLPREVPASLHGGEEGLARAAGAGGEVGDLEPGVVPQEGNVLLADHAGGPEYADGNFS
jgi:hypothetical protein